MRVQPRKVRIIADEIRGKNAAQAANILRFHPSKSARFLRKILVSAMANASENNNLAVETLKISAITVDEGPRLKRIQARAMGRAFRIVKKTSHITVVVTEGEAEARIKPHGTKEKPRRVLDAPKKAKKADAAPVEEVVAAPVDEVIEAPVEEATTEATATEEVVAQAPVADEAPVEEAPVEADATATEVDAVVAEEPAADATATEVDAVAADATTEEPVVTAEETPADENEEGKN